MKEYAEEKMKRMEEERRIEEEIKKEKEEKGKKRKSRFDVEEAPSKAPEAETEKIADIREDEDEERDGKDESEEEIEVVTEEELAMRVRRMLTEILLDVTNSELRHVAEG